MSYADGMVRWISRWMDNRHSVTNADIARHFNLSYRQTQRYIRELKRRGIIYNRYKDKCMHYSLIKYRRKYGSRQVR